MILESQSSGQNLDLLQFTYKPNLGVDDDIILLIMLGHREDQFFLFLQSLYHHQADLRSISINVFYFLLMQVSQRQNQSIKTQMSTNKKTESREDNRVSKITVKLDKVFIK